MGGYSVLSVNTVFWSVAMKGPSDVQEVKVLHFLKSSFPCEECGKPLDELCCGIMVCKACGVAYDAIFFRPEGG